MDAISQTKFSKEFSSIKCLNSDYNFTEMCSQGSNRQLDSFNSDNDLAPFRRHVIN